MNSMQTFHTIFIVCLTIGIILTIAAIVEFFVFRIAKTIKDITGITQKKEIKSMSHYETGNLSWHKVHTTGLKERMMSKSGRLNANETAVMSDESQTLLLSGNQEAGQVPYIVRPQAEEAKTELLQGQTYIPPQVQEPAQSYMQMQPREPMQPYMQVQPEVQPQMQEPMQSYMQVQPQVQEPIQSFAQVQQQMPVQGFNEEPSSYPTQGSEDVTTILKINPQLDIYQESETTVLDAGERQQAVEAKIRKHENIDIHFTIERQIILINTQECIG